MTPNDFVKLLVDELKSIAAGTSKFTNGAILFDPKKLPFAAILERFAAAPTKELMKEVVKIAEQDFGSRFGNYVGVQAEKLNTEFFKEQPAPVPEPAPEVPFKQELYVQLTTILTRGRDRAIEPAVHSVLQQDINRLADAIDARINKLAQEQAHFVCQLAIKMLGEEIDKLQVQINNVGTTARQASKNSAGGMRIG